MMRELVGDMMEAEDGTRFDTFTSLLHETEKIIQKFFPSWVTVQFIKL